MSKNFAFTENATPPTCYIAGSRESGILTRPETCSFFLLLSFFLAVGFFFHTLNRILIKLGHNHAWGDSYRSYTLYDPRGHLGVTGVKSSFSRKTFQLLYIIHDYHVVGCIT